MQRGAVQAVQGGVQAVVQADVQAAQAAVQAAQAALNALGLGTRRSLLAAGAPHGGMTERATSAGARGGDGTTVSLSDASRRRHAQEQSLITIPEGTVVNCPTSDGGQCTGYTVNPNGTTTPLPAPQAEQLAQQTQQDVNSGLQAAQQRLAGAGLQLPGLGRLRGSGPQRLGAS